MVPKLPVSAVAAIFRELSDQNTRSFYKNLNVNPFLSKSLSPGVQEKRKKLGAVKRSKKCWVE